MEQEALIRDVGPRVAELRRLSGLSRAELAQRVDGVDMMWVVALEDGRTAPTLEDVGRVAEALELPVDELLVGPVRRSWWGRVSSLWRRDA